MNKKSQNNGWMKNIHVTLEVFSMNEKMFFIFDIIDIIRMIIIRVSWGGDDGSKCVVNRFWSARLIHPKFIIKKIKKKKKTLGFSIVVRKPKNKIK
jgi:hypothetical protein